MFDISVQLIGCSYHGPFKEKIKFMRRVDLQFFVDGYGHLRENNGSPSVD
jgi:hypothetical protein